MPTRRKNTCAPDHICTDQEISELIKESRQVHEDPNLQEYVNPTLEQLQQINATAQKYTDDWFWAKVTLNGKEILTPEQNTPEYLKEYDILTTNPDEHGVYLTYYLGKFNIPALN